MIQPYYVNLCHTFQLKKVIKRKTCIVSMFVQNVEGASNSRVHYINGFVWHEDVEMRQDYRVSSCLFVY